MLGVTSSSLVSPKNLQKKIMTSRDRLLTALSGKIPDRVPISTYELCARNSRSFENNESSYSDLMNFIRQNTDAITYWGFPSNHRKVYSSYKPDETVELSESRGFHVQKKIIRTPHRTLTATSKWTDDIKTTWAVEHLCKNTADVDALMNLPWEPVTYNAEDYPRIISELGNNAEHGIIMTSVGDPVLCAMELMEFGEAMVWALTEKEHFGNILKELHRRNIINIKNMLETQKQELLPIDLYRIVGPEYITPPYLPPSYFEEFVFPYMCEIVELIHSCGAMARIHCHGRIGRVLDMMIASGADAIDPCEAPPDGDIELADVKKKCAGKMTIFGNLELKLLEQGTTNDVKHAVRNCMKAAKEGGGYVILPTAAPINIPLEPQTAENYKTFITTALEEGRY